jgi:hypothetical protein
LDTFQSTVTLLATTTRIQASAMIHSTTYVVNANATYHREPPCTWIFWVCV